jgi:hypothetical protein
MRETGREKHQFGGLVARIVGTVTEVHAGAAQRTGTTIDGGADGFGRRVG